MYNFLIIILLGKIDHKCESLSDTYGNPYICKMTLSVYDVCPLDIELS